MIEQGRKICQFFCAHMVDFHRPGHIWKDHFKSNSEKLNITHKQHNTFP